MPQQPTSPPPVSGRQLAAYLGVSSSLVCMTSSGKYLNRQLRPAQSLKMAELMKAHVHSQKQVNPTPSVTEMQKRACDDCARLAMEMKDDADFILRGIPRLEKRLADMLTKARRDTDWLNTVDRLLEKLPAVKGKKSLDRIWLEYQQVVTLERLQKNGARALMKLEIQIEMKKVKARIYHEAQKKLSKK